MEKKISQELITLTEVEHRARHMAQSGLDQCSLDQHSDRWNKVHAQINKEFLADDDQEPFKQSVATKLRKDCSFNLRKTQDEGVFTVTAEATKVGVSKNIQGSVRGAWLIDTLERTLKMVSQTERTEHELIACCKRAENTTQEDFEKGRAAGPMLVTRSKAHFSYLQEGSCPQETAPNFHVGLVGSTVAARLPLVGCSTRPTPHQPIPEDVGKSVGFKGGD